MDFDGGQRKALLAQAVLAYADSCTLPKLTPTCPFFRLENDTPSCNEECRAISDSLGAPERPIGQHVLGGLVMRGREIPLKVASGVEDFDAAREYMEHKHLAPRNQSTAALLVGLNLHGVKALLGESEAIRMAWDLWEEIRRRELPVARIAAAGLSSRLSEVIIARVVRPQLSKLGLVPSSPIDSEETEFRWYQFMLAVKGELELNQETYGSTRVVSRMRVPATVSSMISDTAGLRNAIRKDAVLRFSLSNEFSNRLTQWFGRLLGESSEISFSNILPGLAVFTTLPRFTSYDEFGRWIWERFTLTDIKEWSPTSLAHEWSWLSTDENSDIPPRILLERPMEADQISTAYFQKMLSRPKPVPQTGFRAAEFAKEAADRLQRGNPKGAAEIFEGITDLDPTSADAWNNLGFCLLATDNEAALNAFGRSAMYSSESTSLRIANHVLALHLLGRDADALLLSEVEINPTPAPTGAWVWDHFRNAELGTLTFVDSVDDYLKKIVNHIINNECV